MGRSLIAEGMEPVLDERASLPAPSRFFKSEGEWPGALVLRGAHALPDLYRLVKARRNGSAVYRSAIGNTFLRCGPGTQIVKEHRRQLQNSRDGYPVARILASGLSGHRAWYVEKSIGKCDLGQAFAAECREQGSVSAESLAKYFEIVERWAAAAARHTSAPDPIERTLARFGIEQLATECPAVGAMREALLKKLGEDLKGIPLSALHGDLQPFNVFPRGIIDFEDRVTGPVGYDLVTAISFYSWFPDKSGPHAPAYWFDAPARSHFYERIFRPFCQRLSLEPRTLFRALYTVSGCWAAAGHPWRHERAADVCRKYLSGDFVFEDGEY